MRPRIYVDTSAYLCVLLGEEGSPDLAETMAGARLQSTVLLVLEARRNLVRLTREAKLAATKLNDLLDRVRHDAEAFALADVTLDLCFEHTFPAMVTPRSLDLAHLRTALWFHRREPLQGFLSCDTAQLQAARELGLPT